MSKSFLWGSSISAGQCEGGFDSRSPTVVDIIPQGKTTRMQYLNHPGIYLQQPEGFYPSQKGVEFYEHYKEDIALYAKMGIKALRFSILWSRIFLDERMQVNEKGLQFYDNVINELLKYHIEPIITTIHFDMPLWVVQKYNGFVNRKVVDLYQQYVQTIVERYHDRVKYWISYCEINVMNKALYMVAGTVLNEEQDREKTILQCAYHLLLGNALFVKTCHDIDPSLQTGCEVAGSPVYPLTSSPLDYQKMMEEERLDHRFTDVMVKGKIPYYLKKELKDHHIQITSDDETLFAHHTLDFIAVSYYKTQVASYQGHDDNPLLEKTAFGWTIDDLGMRLMLNRLYERYEVPIFIVENGLGTYDQLEDQQIHDDYRIDYLSKHIQQMELAIQDGVEVIGYLTWSAMDVVSTSEGMMSKRYGFIYVDRNDDGSGTYQRIPKDSFYWYRQLIQEKDL